MSDRRRSVHQLAGVALAAATLAACGSADTPAADDEPTAAAADRIDDLPAPTDSDDTEVGRGIAGASAAGSASDDAPASTSTTTPPAVSAGSDFVVPTLNDDEQAAADLPLASALAASLPAGFAPPDAASTRCVGGKVVDQIGVDRLTELGITVDSADIFGPTEFDPDEIETIIDVVFECVDVGTLIASSFATDAGPDTTACFGEYLTDDLIRDLSRSFLSGAEIDTGLFLATVQEANAACLPGDG